MNKLSKLNIISRMGLGFVFFYHGLMPKILWLSSTEVQLIELHNTGIPSAILSSVAGTIEIIVALLIVGYRKSLVPVYIAAVSLILLVLDVAWVMPSLLVEAFNPVTTNVMGLILCYCVFLTQVENEKGGVLKQS